MADWPFVEGAQLLVQTANPATSVGHVTLSGTIGAKPASPTQLVASTPWDAVGVGVTFVDQAATASVLVDIMAGSAGNEWVLIPDLLRAGSSAMAKAGTSYFFPIFVPAGTRLSGRAAVSAACNVDVALSLLRGSTAGTWSKVTAYGADVANARGTVVNAGGTAHTKGAVSELTAATSDPARLLTVAIGAGGDMAKAAPVNRLLTDIMAGASGGEHVLVGDLPATTNSALGTYAPTIPLANAPVYLPRGSRLSARTQCTSIDAGDRLSDVIVYGVS